MEKKDPFYKVYMDSNVENFCRKKYTRLYNTFDRDGLTVSGTVPDSGTVTDTVNQARNKRIK